MISTELTPKTPKRIRKGPLFLRELRENGGFVSKACEAVAVSKQTVYNWRESDPEFAADWDKAVDLATEDLEKEARRRAYQGVKEPVFYKGEVCGHIQKYSDTLLMFVLKARKPEYRDSIRFTIDESDDLSDSAARKFGLPVPGQVKDETERPAS